METWWAERLDPALSQGDIVDQLFLFRPVVPRVTLASLTAKGGRAGWVHTESPKADRNGHFHVLARGKLGLAIVLSHSCELDKAYEGDAGRAPGREFALVAPVRLAKTITNLEDRQRILEQGDYHAVGLLSIPAIGDCYADLRHIAPVDRIELDASTRRASMTDQGRQRLHDRLTVFFSTRDPEAFSDSEQSNQNTAAR